MLRSILLLSITLGWIAPPYLAQSKGNELEQIEIRVEDFVFDALAAGPLDGELVLLLHGFPQAGYAWRNQLPVLAALGFRVVAPDQRGYSAGARPPEVSDYVMEELVGDVLGMATALGYERFHLVGHDWGAAVAWILASSAPERIRSLVALSTPHMTAFASALSDPNSAQSQASSYMTMFRSAGSEQLFLANEAQLLKSILSQFSSSETDLDVYLSVLGTPDALRAALNWYRAAIPSQGDPPPASPAMVSTPTLYVWSTEDCCFDRGTAEASEDFVTGPYQFEVLEGVSHWIAEEATDDLNELLVEHLEQWRGR